MTATTDRLASALETRYRIDRELGAGGMATVYLAEDLRHDRKVAIKVLKPELAAVLGADAGRGTTEGSSNRVAKFRYLVTLNWFDELRRQLAAQQR